MEVVLFMFCKVKYLISISFYSYGDQELGKIADLVENH
jgi:hypothetical protein